VDQILARGERRHPFSQHAFKFLFDLRDDGRQRAAAIAGFVLDAVPVIGIVASSDDDAAGRAAIAYQVGNRGCRAWLVRQPDWGSACADHFSDCRRHAIGSVPMVVADQHALARVFAAHDIARNGLRHDARVGECEIFRNHAAPAVGAKLDRAHCR
jgi:hypothetical protein